MSYPYTVMRALAGPMAKSMFTIYLTQLQSLEKRTKRTLQAGVPQDQAQALHTLLKGCRAAMAILEETPEIIERWDASDDDEPSSTVDDDDFRTT